jgi:hypothetical protein
MARLSAAFGRSFQKTGLGKAPREKVLVFGMAPLFFAAAERG